MDVPVHFSSNYDVRSLIYQHLPLRDVVVLRKVSREFKRTVDDDKQLWLHLLACFQASTGSPIIPYHVDLDAASAGHVTAWLKQAALVRRTLSTDVSLSNSYTLAQKQPITWVKLIRGRWCLVASANTYESQLRVWDLDEGSFDNPPKETFYLPGPVVDGIVEDSGNEIRIAMSIGIRVPEIRIYSLHLVNRKVELLLMATVKDACHIRMLSGDFIGFAVCKGDDSHSYIADWRSNVSPISLVALPHTSREGRKSKTPAHHHHSPCLAMHKMDNIIVVLHGNSIEVFNLDSWTGHSSISSCQSIILGEYLGEVDYIAEGFFYVQQASMFYPNRGDGPGYIHFTTRSPYSIILTGSIQVASRFDVNCSLLGPNLLQAAGRGNEGLEPLKLYMGSSHGYLTYLSGCSDRTGKGYEHQSTFESPSLMAARVVAQTFPSYDAPIKGASADLAMPISRVGLPLLHFLNSLDFDDAAGVLLIGTSRGELYLGRIADLFLARGSTVNGLPERQPTSDFAMSKSIVPTELPSFFYLRKQFKNCSAPLPSILVEEAQQTWNSANTGVQPIPDGWSNNWEENRNLRSWLAPKSLWGDTDADLVDSNYWSVRIRCTLPTLGEIIPVMYHKRAHDLVIFRIGLRAYYCCDCDPEWDATPYHIGTLSKNFETPFRSDELDSLYLTRLKGDLDFCMGDFCRTQFVGHFLRATATLKFAESEAGLVSKHRWSISDCSEDWSGADWSRLDDDEWQLEWNRRTRREDGGGSEQG